MNYRKLASWQEAEKIIPVGGTCFLDPRGERWVTWSDEAWWWPNGFCALPSTDMQTYVATPYEATEKEVPISAAEAAARLVEGLPVEVMIPGDKWKIPHPSGIWTFGPGKPMHDYEWRIPAAQPEEDIYQIAVPKGTDMPENLTIVDGGMAFAKARVVKQEVKE